MNYENVEWADCITVHREMRVSKKERKCDCGKTIHKGEKYRREFGVIDDNPFVSIVGMHIEDSQE